MTIDLMKLLTIAMATATVVQNADQNRDGKVSSGELASACAAEISAVVMVLPELTGKVGPVKIQAAAVKLAELVQILTQA